MDTHCIEVFYVETAMLKRLRLATIVGCSDGKLHERETVTLRLERGIEKQASSDI
ncbi:MAG: hypothetical protein HC874_04300 [Richelia sp. SL_2_1]|nr:hypothetical protein [Richelia sp. SL_2_1]